MNTQIEDKRLPTDCKAKIDNKKQPNKKTNKNNNENKHTIPVKMYSPFAHGKIFVSDCTTNWLYGTSQKRKKQQKTRNHHKTTNRSTQKSEHTQQKTNYYELTVRQRSKFKEATKNKDSSKQKQTKTKKTTIPTKLYSIGATRLTKIVRTLLGTDCTTNWLSGKDQKRTKQQQTENNEHKHNNNANSKNQGHTNRRQATNNWL